MSATAHQLFGELQLLVQRVPRAPEDAIPPGVSEQEVEEFAARNQLTVPTELAQYLELSNGPCIGPGGLLGIRTTRPDLDIESIYRIFPDWRAKQWIPVAGDGCGNYYVVVPVAGRSPVVFVDTGLDAMKPDYVVASGVLRFLCSLLQQELTPTGWPFEEALVRRLDPDLASFGAWLPMPWQEALRGVIG